MKNAAFVLALVACHRPTAAPDDAAAVATATTTSTAAPATSGKTYTVRMKRPVHVGDSSHASIDDDRVEHTVTRIAGTQKETRKATHTHVEGMTRLLSLQADGRSPLKDEMTVAEFWAVKNDDPKATLAPAGTKIVIERGATKRDAHVTLDGRAATKDVIDALDHVTSLTLHKGPSDDEVFGTKSPQPIGGEWPVDADLAEKDLKERDIVVAHGSLTGSTKLVAVRAIRGIDCLEIDNHMTIGSIQTIGELPASSTIKNGRIDVHMHVMLPIDETKSALESEMTLTINGTFLVPTPKGAVEVSLDSTDHKRGVELP